MLAWLLNTHLLFEDTLNFLFLKRILHCKALEICYFFEVTSLLLLIHQTCYKKPLIKPFDLLNTFPLTKTKTVANNLLMSFKERAT